MNTNIRIGMIGAGSIARDRHLPGLKKLSGIELTAVANRRYENAKKAAEQHGFQKAVEDWRTVADDPNIDAVFICTPPNMHREMTEYALGRGKHVFCQARMAIDLEDAKRMYDADRKTSLTTMLCPPPHYMKVENRIMEHIKNQAIGEIRHVVVNHPAAMFADPEQPLHWRQRADLQGINMLDVGITGEVLQKWFGPLGIVAAAGRTFTDGRPADQDGRKTVELPDSVQVIGRFQNGATLNASFSAAVMGGKPGMSIHGSAGSIHCHAFEPYYTISAADSERRVEIPGGEGEWTVEEDFIKAVKAGKKGSPSFADGVRYMAFTQAIVDSMQSRKWTDVEQLRTEELI